MTSIVLFVILLMSAEFLPCIKGIPTGSDEETKHGQDGGDYSSLLPQNAEYHKRNGNHQLSSIYKKYLYPPNIFTMPPENIKKLGENMIKRLCTQMADQIQEVEDYFAEIIQKIKETNPDAGQSISVEYINIIDSCNLPVVKHTLKNVESADKFIEIQGKVGQCFKDFCLLSKKCKSYVGKEDIMEVRWIRESEVVPE